MSDFEKPVTTPEVNSEFEENVPTPEEIAELEAETNELAQEAMSLTYELNEVIENPETTAEQLGFLERKVGELKELWDNMDKNMLLPAVAGSGLSVAAMGMAAFGYSEASTVRMEDTYAALGALAAFMATGPIGMLVHKIKEAKSNLVK